MVRSIGAYNINSIRARLDLLGDWLDAADVDVVLLSEIRCLADDFPSDALHERGYEYLLACDHESLPKGRNGVAIVSRVGLRNPRRPLDGAAHWGKLDSRWPADEGRLLLADVGPEDAPVTVGSLYVPNGRELDHWHFGYKLAWLDALRRVVETHDGPLVLGGDFNVAPADCDVYAPKRWVGRTHVTPEERSRVAALGEAGLVDLWRATHPDPPQPDALGFTWWNYRVGSYDKGQGLRIDLLLASADLAARVDAVEVHHEYRTAPKPSDHAPVVARFRS
ncbi:MAG: exodeoxyribonuclease III [Acidimicrobiia bacterium]